MTSDIPRNWELSTLGDISEKPQYGWTTKANHENGSVKLLRTTDITSGELDWASVPFCTDAPEDTDKYLLHPGDIVISRAGSVGFSYLLTSTEKAVFASYLIRFRIKEGIEKKYIYYFLKSPDYWKAIGASKLGIAVQNVNATKLAQVQIPIAPPEQQKRIVAEIEKQFSRLDEAVANLKRAKANLKRYKAAVLKAAVEGKLTEEWRKQHPDVEPASKLLERILAERRQKWEEAELAKMKTKGKAQKDDKWKKKYKEPVPCNVIDMPQLPCEWDWVSMDSLIVWGPQNGLYLPKTAYKPGIAILRIDDYQDGHCKNAASLQQVKTTDDNVERYGLGLNDLVINRVNSPSHLGKCMFVKERNLPSLFESNMMRLRLASSVKVEYIELYLHSKSGKTRLIENAKWAVNQASINQGDVSMTAVPLPPEKEQEEILNGVSSMLSVVAELEDSLFASLRRAGRLRQSILQQAFSGRLISTSTSAEYLNDKKEVAHAD